MMVLSARIVRNKKKKIRWCAHCSGPITSMFITTYGMADEHDKPFSLEYHARCAKTYSANGKISLALSAVDYLQKHPEATINAAFAAAKGVE